MLSIPPEVARVLGYYVYLYVDPRSNRPFYVGKGCGERVLAHLSATGESRKVEVLNELRAAGLEPRLDILAHGLGDEETALRIEAAVIDLCGLGDLTNEVRGWRSVQLGRIPLSELIVYYAAKPVTVTHPALLIRINRLYRHGMAEDELYEATRGVWKLGTRRGDARYALAVFEGVVRQVYEIDSWHRAGTTQYKTRTQKSVDRPDRWEFTGRIASENLRSQYVGFSVAAYFPKGLQSPVVYANC
jgi:hypothetical protein